MRRGGPTLVVLDDDEWIAAYMATVAKDCGWTARTVADETLFQMMVRGAPPDAIMLDLQLGSSDGIEQLRFLHQQGYAGAVVLMSGFDPRVLAAAEQVGGSLGLTIAGTLAKPARAARIREVLTAIQHIPILEPVEADDSPQDDTVFSPDDVAQAIDGGLMELYLQPIVSADGLAVKRAEALVRWRDPVLGLVTPERFVPVAETDEAVIDRLTMWVAETGVAQYRRLAALGSPIQVCINVSGRNLQSLDFPDRMASLLHRESVPTGAIGLEVTESVAMDDPDATTSTLTRLRLKGFPVAIDDFGMGHSTFDILRRMPFSTIKIDKSFVREVETSSDSFNIVKSVIQLARDMQLASVAEGVENADAARLLAELGIDSLQGHFFSPPRPFEAFAGWLCKRAVA